MRTFPPSLVLFSAVTLSACADPSAPSDSVPIAAHTPGATLQRTSSSGPASAVGATSTALSGLGEGDFHIVGDLNGDGYDDIVAIDAATGGVAVYNGRRVGPSSTPSRTLTLTVGAESVIEGAGDVNGDGYDDLVIGDPTFSGGQGRVLVYLGSRRGVAARSSQTLRGRISTDGLGSELARLGDVNGDGHDDIGVTLQTSQSVRVYLGGSSGLNTSGYTTLSSPFHTASALVATITGTTGSGISGGDVNGDGFGDVVISYPQWNTEDGAFYTYLGGPTGMSTTGSLTTYPYPGSYSSWCDGSPYMGWAVDAHEDFDGDGYSDVVASAPYDMCDGFVYVWYGSSTGTQSARWSEQYGYTVGAYQVGLTVGVGDLNGDGYDDLGMGGYTTSYSQGPLAESSASSENLQNVTPISGTTAWVDWSTYSFQASKVQGQGDVNGDGYDDLLVGVNVSAGVWNLIVEYGSP